MSLKKILIIVAVVISVVLIALLVRSFQLHTDSLYGLKVTGDGSGGAIAIYEDRLGGSIYAQKIGSDGKTLWGEKGVHVGGSGSKSYNFFNLNIAGDGSGGQSSPGPTPLRTSSGLPVILTG